MKLTAQQKKAIKEAFLANDTEKLGKLLKECGCSLADAAVVAAGKEPAAKGKSAKEAKEAKGAKTRKTEEAEPRKKKAGAAADDADDDAADDAEDTTEVDHDAELDAAVDDVVAEAEDEDDAEDGDDAEDLEEDDAEDGDDADEDDADETEDDVVAEAEEAEQRRHPLSSSAAKLRQHASTREAGKGKPLTMGSKSKGGKVHGPGNGKTAVDIVGSRRKQHGGQKGRRFGEAAATDLGALRRDNDKLRETNARLSSQLRVRTTADRARKLLRESSIPEKLRPEILRHMIGKSEDEMRSTVRYHERLITTAIEEASYGEMGGSRVEGAGSRIREGFHGSNREDDDFGSLLEESGIPLVGDDE